jgi:hypothetical protein
MSELDDYRKALEEEFEREQGEALAHFRSSELEAAKKITDLIKHSENPHIRLKASMYVLDNTVFAKNTENDSLTEFLKKMGANSQ